MSNIEQAILGGGCFWCVEAVLQRLKGVIKVIPGYCGGHKQNPIYKQVKTGTTGHIEVVKIDFNPDIINYQILLTVFMHIHDPTQADGQGQQDIGSQYLSAIFCQNDKQKQTAKRVIEKQQEQVSKQGKKIYTLLREKEPFYQAEEYHHNYYNIRGKQNPYCNIIPPKIAKMKHLFKNLVSQNA